MSWEKVDIGNLVTLRQGFAINKKTKHYLSDVPTNLPLLRIADMRDSQKNVFVNDAIPSKFIAKSDDIIYTRTGQVGLVFTNQFGVVHNNCFTVTPKDETILCRQYLYYALQNKEFVNSANSKATGAAQPDLPHDAFNTIPIYLPPIKTQQHIADILFTYDKLIQNNRKQIKLLEEAAQRLYKEWFVDLCFPGHEHTKIVDGVPEGWEVDVLSNVVKTTSGGTPARSHSEYYVNGSNLWVKTQELTDGFILDTEEKITDDAIKNSSAKLVSKGSILMAMYGATIGRLGIATQDLTCNQACCVFDVSDFKYGAMYLFCWLLENRSFLVKLGKGAAQLFSVK